LKDKSLLCRENDGGRFAFFLDDYEELKEATDIMREQARDAMDLETGEKVQKLMRTMNKFWNLIDHRLTSRSADVKISSIPQPEPSPKIDKKREIQPIEGPSLIQLPSNQAGSLEKTLLQWCRVKNALNLWK
jgi:hypothetical protein